MCFSAADRRNEPCKVDEEVVSTFGFPWSHMIYVKWKSQFLVKPKKNQNLSYFILLDLMYFH